jgi:predicted permease
MSNVALLFLCLAAGVALRASGRVPDNAHLAINGFIINISLPALTLLQIHGIELHSELMLPILMPWLMFAGVAASIWLIGRRLQLAPATTGALILTAGLANTSFVGVPMIEIVLWRTLYGDRPADRSARYLPRAQHAGHRDRLPLLARQRVDERSGA